MFYGDYNITLKMVTSSLHALLEFKIFWGE